MSNRSQHNPPPSPASTMPDGWNESAAFRETTLQHFTEPAQADLLRAFGVMLHDMALELAPEWPLAAGSGTAAELRAAMADLRFLQGYLTLAGQDRNVSSLSPAEEVLAQLAERLAQEVARIADALERALG